jgi:hypothetical protein
MMSGDVIHFERESGDGVGDTSFGLPFLRGWVVKIIKIKKVPRRSRITEGKDGMGRGVEKENEREELEDRMMGYQND